MLDADARLRLRVVMTRPRSLAAFVLSCGLGSCSGAPATSPSPSPVSTAAKGVSEPLPSGGDASGREESVPHATIVIESTDAPPHLPTPLFAGSRDPSISHPELLAVDPAGRRGFVRVSDGDHRKVELFSFSLDTGERIATWRNNAAHPVNAFGFARLAFQPLTSDRATDLVRYAEIAVHADERMLSVPEISVSQDAGRIGYLVLAPPMMQIAVAEGTGDGERRIGTPAMRGRAPSLSPDGRWIAFSACSPDARSNECARSLYVADLETSGAVPRKLDVAWPSRVAWDTDSRGLWTTRMIARERATLHSDQRRSCLQQVDVVTGDVVDLVCADEAYDADFALAPDRRTAVFLAKRGSPPSLSNALARCDLVERACAQERPIPMLVGGPMLTDDGYVVAAGYLGLPWAIDLRSWQHGTQRGSGWYGRAARSTPPHDIAWLELGPVGPPAPDGAPTATFTIWGLDARQVSEAGPPVKP